MSDREVRVAAVQARIDQANALSRREIRDNPVRPRRFRRPAGRGALPAGFTKIDAELNVINRTV
jgi:hypothetical protein